MGDCVSFISVQNLEIKRHESQQRAMWEEERDLGEGVRVSNGVECDQNTLSVCVKMLQWDPLICTLNVN